MKRFEIIFMVLQVPLDFFMLVLAGISAYILRFTDIATEWKPVLFDLTLPEYLAVVFIVIPIWMLISAMLGLYSPDANRKFVQETMHICLVGLSSLAAIAVYIMFTQQPFDSRFLIVVSLVLAILYVSLGRMIMRGIKVLFYKAGIGHRRVVLIGQGPVEETIEKILDERTALGYKVVKTFHYFTDSVKREILKLKPDEIIFTNARSHEEEVVDAISFASTHHIVFKYSADLFSTYAANMVVYPLAGIPIIELKRTPLDGWGRVVKRTFDILMSIVMIVLLSPIMILAALFIMIETGFPIIYKNERVGLRGKKFFTYKFRSMYKKDSTGAQFGKEGEKAEKREQELIKNQSIKDGPVYKIANDPRVTSVGKFLRRFSIDEIPQFFNVLKGEMSIVGPRPHQPREVAKYNKDHLKVFTLKPGITGLAQISGRSDLSFDDEHRLDAFYIEKWTLLLDIVIFLKTPFVLFRKRKAL
jgi:exopolysaccharide biosynthesis polyprenyl glycosylphosphotransferase